MRDRRIRNRRGKGKSAKGGTQKGEGGKRVSGAKLGTRGDKYPSLFFSWVGNARKDVNTERWRKTDPKTRKEIQGREEKKARKKSGKRARR